MTHEAGHGAAVGAHGEPDFAARRDGPGIGGAAVRRRVRWSCPGPQRLRRMRGLSKP